MLQFVFELNLFKNSLLILSCRKKAFLTVRLLNTQSLVFSSNALVGFFVCLFVFCFLGPHPQHMEVPRLGF